MTEPIVFTKKAVHEVRKCWGFEEWHVNNELYCKKTLWVAPRFQSSLHYHPEKDEWWQIDKGMIIAEINDTKYLLTEGMSVRIRPGIRHRFINPSFAIPTSITEVSTPHKDEDVVRIEESRKLGEHEWLTLDVRS